MVQDESPAPGCGLYSVHDALSQVTESRRRCMPYDGTLDFPVIFVITAINIVAISLGTAKLAAEGEIISLRGTEEQNVKMIALVLGLVEAMPGVMFLWCDPHRRFCARAHGPPVNPEQRLLPAPARTPVLGCVRRWRRSVNGGRGRSGPVRSWRVRVAVPRMHAQPSRRSRGAGAVDRGDARRRAGTWPPSAAVGGRCGSSCRCC